MVELLVVILIIGILAAIALPAFLGQRSKGQDASAKTNARNLASQVEACFANRSTYVGCTAAITTANSGLSIGTGPEQVQVTAETSGGYEIVAISKSDMGGANHTFTIVHNIGGVFERTCTIAGQGACKSDGTW